MIGIRAQCSELVSKGSSLKTTSIKTIFIEPANYRICLIGKPSNTLYRILGDWQIQELNEKDCTLLTGWIQDQADLMGVLNTIHELHYSIESINMLGKKE